MSAATIEAPVVIEAPTDDDPARKAHYVRCPEDKESAAAWIAEAAFLGLEVEAACGYRWVPHRDARRLPVCPRCAEIVGDVLLGKSD